MEIEEKYRLDSYGYDLPDGLIAQEPSDRRDGSRLMVLDREKEETGHFTFSDLPTFLRTGDCLVVNETRVVPARLFVRKPTGGLVELLAVRYREREFDAMFRTHRGLKHGLKLGILDRNGNPAGEELIVKRVHGDGTATVGTIGNQGPRAIMDAWGRVPVPPYIRRDDDLRHELDCERYQTVYARREGAVAAPTAGLHFTDEILALLEAKGVDVARVCLHVGPGTFKPINCDDIRGHRVGSEQYSVSPRAAAAINRTIKRGGRVIAVGTTVVRTLEASWDGAGVGHGSGETDLFILPGHDFKAVSGMVTNFHLPGSSLLVLVSAFCGRGRILDAYRCAVEMGYRFYSYGDAMLIL
ncbi:MAG: tRNA preQ1(34) S-adenosylmethionine ribosyltransferase-isomerase QueA [Deltaproteobacteria bacterium]|nr:tRNA preQ1(34) S-adenosylmethionine ribosyltransferase-isomerase QueA [Deltaproteobacteria bacterium]